MNGTTRPQEGASGGREKGIPGGRREGGASGDTIRTPAVEGLKDSCGRTIDYLRISVTDRCNLRCFYCLPAAGIELKRMEDILSYEEMERVVRCAVRLGIRKVRVTGGEPLVRKGLVHFLARIAAIPGLEDLSLTTNGIRLSEMGAALRQAGVRRLNVSLDSLRPDRFRRITRGGDVQQVLAGLRLALALGFEPVKVNMVVMRGINDDEVLAFAQLTRRMPLHVRFIELMPLGESHPWAEHLFVPAAEVKDAIEAREVLLPARDVYGNGPARYFHLEGAAGTIGFISPLTEHFCERCNRIRLTADGKINPCLTATREIDLRPGLRAGHEEALAVLLRRALAEKPERHDMVSGAESEQRRMSRLGG